MIIIIPRRKKIDEELALIHYWSDPSPLPNTEPNTYLIQPPITKSNIDTGPTWIILKVDIPKVPVIYLEGKRLTEEAIRCGKTVIQDAESFYS